MKYVCIDPTMFVYPDIAEYAGSSDAISVLTPRGSYACAQILFTDVPGDTLSVDTEGISAELYEMVSVHVERNEGLDENNARPHQPERKAPFDVYDCLKPVNNGTLSAKNGVCGLYLAVKIERDAQPGVISGSVRAGGISVPVTVEISPVTVPEESLVMILGYSRGKVCSYHHVEENSPEFERLDTAYLKMLRRTHQNMLYCPKPRSVPLGENRWDFDFSEMERFMTKAISLGFTRFNFGLGFRQSWSKSTILVNEMPSMSFECYCYLAQLLPRLVGFLREHDWLDRLILGIADEPNNANATEYRALCSLVRKFAPELRLLDAMSFGPVHGAVDIWIPLNAEYQTHRTEIETFRTYGDEIWFYDCCTPRGGDYINRFLDYPLLATRYHFWAGYLYHLTGYLHWAANNYMPGQDPFVQSCPEHHNADSMCYLPAGDTHIMYPGDGEPWMSVRLENQRASAEEYELLCLLAEKDQEKADTICRSVCRSFSDVTYDPTAFRSARNALIRALEDR